MMSNYSSRNPLAGVYSPKTIHTPLNTAAVVTSAAAVTGNPGGGGNTGGAGYDGLDLTSSPFQTALIQQQQQQQQQQQHAVITDVVSLPPVVNIPGKQRNYSS